MKLSETLYQAFNDQIQAEAHSGYLYLAMAAYFESENFEGFSSWMQLQAREEMGHAERFFKYLFDRDCKPVLMQIDAPPSSWDSPLAVFKAALEHERYITSRINHLLELAAKENDYAALSFLQWFVTEQVEEEANVQKVVDKLEKVGPSTNGLFMLDHRVGEHRGKK